MKGMSLKPLRTGETVAVYTGVAFAGCRVGRMAFSEEGLGDEGRVMVVLTLMSIL